MRYSALLLEKEGSLRDLKLLLGAVGFDCLSATAPTQAAALLDEACPHLIFVDLDALPDEQAMDWVESVKQGPFREVPLSVFSRSTQVGRIQRAGYARVHDYILVPWQGAALSRKVADLCLRARKGGIYVARGSLPAQIRCEADVTAISETGLQIRGPLRMSSAGLESFETPLFAEIGVNKPALRATKTDNCFQIQGWSESDRKLLRHWIRAKRLETIE